MSSASTPKREIDVSGPPPTYRGHTAASSLPEDLTDAQLEHLRFFVRLCAHLHQPATVLHMSTAAQKRSWDRTQAVSTPITRPFRTPRVDERTTYGWTLDRAQAHADIKALLESLGCIKSVQDFHRIVAAYPTLVILHELAEESIGLPTHPDIPEEREYGWFRRSTRIVDVPGTPRAFDWLGKRYQASPTPDSNAG